MAGVQGFICLITNHLDVENTERYITCTFSGQKFAGFAMAIAWLAHDTSEVQLKYLSYKYHVSKQCKNNDRRTKLIG